MLETIFQFGNRMMGKLTIAMGILLMASLVVALSQLCCSLKLTHFCSDKLSHPAAG